MGMLTESNRSLKQCASISKTPTKESKMVCFGGVSARDATYCLTEDIIESLWHTPEEREESRKVIRRTIKGVNKRSNMRNLRGLEMGFDAHRKVRMENKRDDILNLQYSNIASGADPSKGLKGLCVALGKSDRQRALLTANDDAAEACRVHKETMSSKLVNKCFQERSLTSRIAIRMFQVMA